MKHPLLLLAGLSLTLGACTPTACEEQAVKEAVLVDQPPSSAGPFNPAGPTIPSDDTRPTDPVVISEAIPVDSLAISVRVDPPPTTAPDPCENHEGLYCLPFAPPGLTECEEMNFYRIQFNLPDVFSDQPRVPAVSFARQGIGWRESNCKNNARPTVKAASCCRGYWAVATSNITAPGYALGFANCGVSHGADYYGTSPLQKQKSACVAHVLYQWWLDHPGSKWPWVI